MAMETLNAECTRHASEPLGDESLTKELASPFGVGWASSSTSYPVHHFWARFVRDGQGNYRVERIFVRR